MELTVDHRLDHRLVYHSDSLQWVFRCFASSVLIMAELQAVKSPIPQRRRGDKYSLV